MMVWYVVWYEILYHTTYHTKRPYQIRYWPVLINTILSDGKQYCGFKLLIQVQHISIVVVAEQAGLCHGWAGFLQMGQHYTFEVLSADSSDPVWP